jgi:phosphoserine phosphatase
MPIGNLPIVDGNAIVERLSTWLGSREALLAFDADGTLWSGDVSDDVFLSACQEGWLLDAARPALSERARSLGLDTSGSASRLGLALFEAQKQGLLEEVQLYAVMAWCYAGHTLGELTAYAEKVLFRKNLSQRIRSELSTVINWARLQSIDCYVVSASPTPIVTLAAAQWGFAPDHVIGSMPNVCDGVVAPAISADVPFGANKCKLLRRRAGNKRWLACFGDSEFDFELLQGAELAVAVSPKADLLARLLPLSHAVVLSTNP